MGRGRESTAVHLHLATPSRIDRPVTNGSASTGLASATCRHSRSSFGPIDHLQHDRSGRASCRKDEVERSAHRPPRKRAACSAALLGPVGVTGFEPATTCTPCKCATGLRYTPMYLSRISKRSTRHRRDALPGCATPKGAQMYTTGANLPVEGFLTEAQGTPRGRTPSRPGRCQRSTSWCGTSG